MAASLCLTAATVQWQCHCSAHSGTPTWWQPESGLLGADTARLLVKKAPEYGMLFLFHQPRHCMPRVYMYRLSSFSWVEGGVHLQNPILCRALLCGCPVRVHALSLEAWQQLAK